MKRLVPYLIIIPAALLMIIFPEMAVSCAENACRMCGEIIIPSLFPFFVCSGLLVRSGLAERAAIFAKPIMRPLFNIHENGAAAFILGIISGYPLGAVTACELYDKGCITKSEAERLLAFCNNSGPLFILGAVGSAMFSSVSAGIILYTAPLLAAVSVGIIFRFYRNTGNCVKKVPSKTELKGFSEIFPAALSAAADSMITVCCAIIFFSTVSGIITQLLPLDEITKAVICGIAELTSGTKSISALPLPAVTRLVMSAFTVGFAGLCVHLQVVAVCAGKGLSLRPYIVGKLFHGTLSAVYTLIILQFVPITESVFREIPQKGAAVMAGSLYQAVTILFSAILACLVILLCGAHPHRQRSLKKERAA